eukprot:3929179-Rhodomonas_salina.1
MSGKGRMLVAAYTRAVYGAGAPRRSRGVARSTGRGYYRAWCRMLVAAYGRLGWECRSVGGRAEELVGALRDGGCGFSSGQGVGEGRSVPDRT